MSLLHKIALTFIKNIGPQTAKSLLTHFGDAESVFRANTGQLLEVSGIGKKTADLILHSEALKRAEEELVFIKKHKIEVLFYTDDNYPKRLKHCNDAPVLLYYKGNADLNHPRIISVVGTRNATDYGRQLCKHLMEILQPYNVLVVSGLAYGIDVAAHQHSLYQNIPTIGVLGHGLDRLYPQIHRNVAQKMVLNGGLLTEFPVNTRPDKQNFPQRNRIIAGISDATIVVEATRKGGALITAEIANSYNKDVYAFPGRVNDEFSEGCNFLIKTHRAGLINHAKDLLYYMGWDDIVQVASPAVQAGLPLGLSPEEEKIFTLLQNEPLSIDDLALKLNMQQSKLAILLLTLEVQGLIRSLPGKVYKLQ